MRWWWWFGESHFSRLAPSVVLLMLEIKLITKIVSHLVICLNLIKTVFTTSQGESYKNRLNFRETQLLITHSSFPEMVKIPQTPRSVFAATPRRGLFFAHYEFQWGKKKQKKRRKKRRLFSLSWLRLRNVNVWCWSERLDDFDNSAFSIWFAHCASFVVGCEFVSENIFELRN